MVGSYTRTDLNWKNMEGFTEDLIFGKDEWEL